MPKFHYIALNQNGQSVEDDIDANSEIIAYDKLRALGLYPTHIAVVTLNGSPVYTKDTQDKNKIPTWFKVFIACFAVFFFSTLGAFPFIISKSVKEEKERVASSKITYDLPIGMQFDGAAFAFSHAGGICVKISDRPSTQPPKIHRYYNVSNGQTIFFQEH